MFNLIIIIVFSLQLGKELTCMRLAGYDKIDWCLKLFHINTSFLKFSLHCE